MRRTVVTGGEALSGAPEFPLRVRAYPVPGIPVAGQVIAEEAKS